MHRFTIDYLTRNTGDSYVKSGLTKNAEINVARHDGLLTDTGSNYLHDSLHLEDVYSVISKDVAIDDVKTHVTSPLTIDLTYDTTLPCQPPTESVNSEILTHTPGETMKPPATLQNMTSEPTTVTEDVGTYNYTLERSTPSPNQDSGIETDNSPISEADMKKTFKNLEKKAKKMSSSSSKDDKPSHSYIALIAMAILDSHDRKSTISDIYKFIMSNFPYYDNEDKAWRNSIRYNLSINECFFKTGKNDAGKGNLWAIHPACLADFERGDFRRRQARRQAKRHLRGPKITEIQPSVTTEPVYQTMTPSYVAYHPYANMGLHFPYQQQMMDYAHAHSGHPTMSSAYYNTTTGYPSREYTPMLSAAGQEYQGNFSHGLSSAFYGYESKPLKASQGQYEDAAKWYVSHQNGDSSDKENIPSNNNIVFS